MQPDVLMLNSIGPAFDFESAKQGLGGSELEVVQIAHALADRGHKVVVANGVDYVREQAGVTYVPLARAEIYWPKNGLYLERMTPYTLHRTRALPERVVVRATDQAVPAYDVHRDMFRAPNDNRILVGVSEWQLEQFGWVHERQRVCVPPILGPTPPTERVPGRFVYASAPIKGLDPTLDMWRQMKRKYSVTFKDAKLVIVTPGHFDFYADRMANLTDEDRAMGISYAGSPSPEAYRAMIASAEGLFYVNTMTETFCCAAAFAERSGTRTHILCRNGFGGIPEAIKDHRYLTDREDVFEERILAALGTPPVVREVRNRSAEHLVNFWELHLGLEELVHTVPVQRQLDATLAAIRTNIEAAGSTLADPAGSPWIRNVLNELRTNLSALAANTAADATVTDYWRSRCLAVAEMAKTKPIENFLSWSNDVHHEELALFHPWYDELRADPQWHRWERLSRKEPWGNPHPFSRDPGTSPVTLQHVHHLMQYERSAGSRFVDGLDMIVEVGGGYGNFCRMLRKDGFKGTHVILDLPHMREFQRAYLRLCGIEVTDEPKMIDGAALLLEKDIDAVLDLAMVLGSRRVGFVATWSLSETPLAYRAKLFPALHACCTKYLMISQWPAHQTDPDIDNESYFQNLVRESGRPSAIYPVHGMGSRYVFMFDKAPPPKRAGTHVTFYDNELPREQPHHVTGGSARRYWAHDRILVGGSIMSADDGRDLAALGVTHVLSAEHERDDAGKWPDDTRLWAPFPDDGAGVPDELLHKAMDFVDKVFMDSSTVLYAHCRMGGSRGPSMAYLALRVGLGYSPAAAMAAIRATREQHWTPHVQYIHSIERAIETRGSACLILTQTTPLIESRVVEAFRNTPAPIRLTRSVEQGMQQEDLAENRQPLPPQFGTYLSMMRSALSMGGSEYGLGLMLMSLVASTRATRVVEIGRFHGFSTLALASGLALADVGWREPTAGQQRPDVNYGDLLAQKRRSIVSIDPYPTAEADDLLLGSGLAPYIEKIDKRSDDVDPSTLGTIDVLFLDGDHTEGGVRNDIARFVRYVRPGGYFVLHDYFGWYDAAGNNGSPIKKAIDLDLQGFERILIDTGFCSFVIFRKNIDLPPQPERAPKREDGRPTVGLLLNAIGDEASTVIARAIVSAWKMVDAVTVVIDGGDLTAEVCKHLGADVYMRKTPEIDWKRGIGAIGMARNEALSIAERKTDYVLVLDPDDTFEGEIPKELVADAYEVTIYDGALRYPRIQLFKSGVGAHYEGVRHEYAVLQGSIGKLKSLRYVRRGGGHQDREPPAIKYMRHAQDLQSWLLYHQDDARAQFYLGQSFRDAGQGEKAIKAYERRIEMGGGEEGEIFFSALQIARIVRESEKDPTAAYMRAYELQPTRAEPLCELANWLRDHRQKRFALAVMVAQQAVAIPQPAEGIFLNADVYQWAALQELAVALYWVGDKRASLACWDKLVKCAPDPLKAHMRSMVDMCVRELGGR